VFQQEGAMSLGTTVTWSDRLTRLACVLILLATASGVIIGAAISMYYDIAPTLLSLDQLPFILYVVAVIVSLPHLLLAAWDLAHQHWHQAAMRALVCVGPALVFVGPALVFVGTEGLLSHLLWWESISQTGRFHLLHHALSAGLPLTLGYGLLVRWWWRPARISTGPAVSSKVWLVHMIWLVVIVGGWGVADAVDLWHPYQGPIVLALVGVGLLVDLRVFVPWHRWRQPTDA
jgi:hypothetical protein